MAESALPAAAQLASRTGAQLTLVHVIEKNAPSEVHSDRHLVGASEAGAYLAEVARRPLLAGLRVVTHVHEVEVSDVARSITEHAAELAPDLVVMSTHGKGSARRMFFGAIAQQVIGLGDTPVLLLRPAEDGPGGGQQLHSARSWFPSTVTRRTSARSRWRKTSRGASLQAGSPDGGSNGRGPRRAAGGRLDAPSQRNEGQAGDGQRGAYEHVEEQAQAISARGVRATSATSRGDPARAIVSAARRLSSDLVVMGTHGRAGTDAFWEGSVAARVISRARVPLLLVPLKGQ